MVWKTFYGVLRYLVFLLVSSIFKVVVPIRPLTAKLRWCLFSSVSHVSDRLELHNNNWASGSKHPGPSESHVYSNVIQEAQSNDLLHTARLLMRLNHSQPRKKSRDLRDAHQSYRARNMHCAFPASFLGKIPNTPKLLPMPGKKFTWAVLKLWDLCLYICGLD